MWVFVTAFAIAFLISFFTARGLGKPRSVALWNACAMGLLSPIAVLVYIGVTANSGSAGKSESPTYLHLAGDGSELRALINSCPAMKRNEASFDVESVAPHDPRYEPTEGTGTAIKVIARSPAEGIPSRAWGHHCLFVVDLDAGRAFVVKTACATLCGDTAVQADGTLYRIPVTAQRLPRR